MGKKKVFIFLITMLALLAIPKTYGYEIGREVYVRHINKDTGQIISGLENATQEVIDENGNSSLLSNSTSDDAEFSYSEYYNFDLSSTMEITKTLVMQVGGVKYNYLGYNVSWGYSLDEAYSLAEKDKSSYRAGTTSLDVVYSSNLDNEGVYTTNTSDSNDVVIIDFYYTEQTVTNISPELHSNTNVWTGSDAEVSNVTYVPAGGTLYPYFMTPSYVVKDLAYEKNISSDGKVTYKVKKFVVYKLKGAYLKSSESKHLGSNGEIEITGTLVDSTDPAAAITGINSIFEMRINNENETIDTLNNLVNTYNSKNSTTLPGRSDIDVTEGEDTDESDYDTNIVLQTTVLNGLRSAKGNVIYSEYDVLSGGESGETVEYESTNDYYINVYTPIKLNDPTVTVTSESSIDHSAVNSSTVILSDDATFTIALSCGDLDFKYYNTIDSDLKAKFVDYYYIIFDFDVVHNGVTYEKGTAIRLTNQSAYNGGYTYFTAQVASNETLSRDADTHKIIILASSPNMPSNDLLQYVVDQEVAIQLDGTQDTSTRKYLTNSGDNTANFSTDIEYSEAHNDSQYTKGVTMYGDGYYFAMKTVTVKTASKIYDFEITDCADLAYKSAFRNSDTNALIGNKYYSGIRRMLVYTTANKEYTALVDRTGISINGTSTTTTLPLGPYKHTTASYTSAPKLGYRFSFDVKTTGYYMPSSSGLDSRKVAITPTYYYISKDGSTLIEDITLYYKDESGKYKQFEGSGYTIYFTPNDGTRVTNGGDTTYMSTKQEALNIASSSGTFYLTDSMMSLSDSGYIQTWYGEFKLPNTTIAVKSGDSINNALTDGYIGVKFEITCYDSSLNESISYSALNKSVNSLVNTTQWDYEGYLGFSNPGTEVTSDTSLRIQLEDGIWSINTQELYEFVKGTVILYDTDARAADDIN